MKRAWEWDYEILSSAVPVKSFSEKIEWDNILEGAWLAEANQMLETNKGFWLKPLPESKAPYSKMISAISCMAAMGYNTDKADALIPEAFKAIEENRLMDLYVISAQVYKALYEAEKIPGHPYWSYTIYEDYDKYLENVTLKEYPEYVVPGKDELYDRVHAGWLGEIIGGALGTSVEGYHSPKLWEVYGEITDYIKEPETENDDLTFELALLKAFEEKGYDISSEDIANKWIAMIPFAYTAEGVAHAHMKEGIYPPESGYFNNPFREMIGAAMRASICGAIAPANPKLAAELAWKDGIISHHNNGVLAEIFNAVLVSAAYAETDMYEAMMVAFDSIPKDSEFYSVLKFALDACEKCDNYRDAWTLCEEKYKEYNWVHTYPNLAAEVVAVYFARNDFTKAMTILMMAGQDNDCTGGPIGHAYGAMFGVAGIPEKFITPLEDRLTTYVRTMEDQKISDLSMETTEAILAALK